jgi:integrase
MATVRKRKWKTASGEVRTGWFVDFYDAEGKRDRKLFDNRREADDFRIEIEGQLRSGTFRADASKVTVRDLANLFITHCEERMNRGEHMTRRNFQTYQGYVRNYMCPDPEWHAAKHARPSHAFDYFDKGIGHKSLAQLTAGVVTRFRDDLRGAGVSVPTTRKILATLQVMLAYGISLDLIAFNAAKDVRVLSTRADDAKQITPPSKEIMRELIELSDETFRVQLVFAAASGVRAGELHALRWRHIIFERREVRIETRVDPYGNEDVPKTKAGRRVIPLGDGVLAALKAWRQASRYPGKDDLVFPNQIGGYLNHDDMVKRRFLPLFGKLVERWKREGINETPEVFAWHALRHFAISCWIDAGLPPKTVQTFAGHSSLQVTMDRYGHLFRSDDHGRAMDAISSEIFQASKPPAAKSNAPAKPAPTLLRPLASEQIARNTVPIVRAAPR